MRYNVFSMGDDSEGTRWGDTFTRSDGRQYGMPVFDDTILAYGEPDVMPAAETSAILAQIENDVKASLRPVKANGEKKRGRLPGVPNRTIMVNGVKSVNPAYQRWILAHQ